MAVNVPTPSCGRCGHLVPFMTWWYDQRKMVHVVVVECHGERERTEISDRDLVMSIDLKIHAGVAFKRDKIVNNVGRT